MGFWRVFAIWNLEGLISDFRNLFTACFKATCGTHWHTQERYNGKERIIRIGKIETEHFATIAEWKTCKDRSPILIFTSTRTTYAPWSTWFDDFHFHVSLMSHGQCTHPFSRCCAEWLTLWVCAINMHVGDGGCPRTVLNQIRNRVRWSLRKGFGAAVAELAGVAELVLKVPSAAKHCMITRTGMTTEILANKQHFWGLWSNLRKQLWRISFTNMLLDPNESPKSIVKVASCSNKKTLLVTQCARK